MQLDQSAAYVKSIQSYGHLAFSCNRCKQLLCSSEMVRNLLFWERKLFIVLDSHQSFSIQEQQRWAVLNRDDQTSSVRTKLVCKGCKNQLGVSLLSGPSQLQDVIKKRLVQWRSTTVRNLKTWQVLENLPPLDNFHRLNPKRFGGNQEQSKEILRTLQEIRLRKSSKETTPHSIKRMKVKHESDSVLFEQTYAVLQYLGQVVGGLQERSKQFESVLRQFRDKFQEQIPKVEKLIGLKE